MNSKMGFVAMLTAFVAALSWVVFQTYNLSTASANKAHLRDLKKDEVRDYCILKDYLLFQVDSLQKVYADLATNHHSPKTINEQLAKRTVILDKLTLDNSDTQAVESLKSKIENLLELKESLETDIAQLQPKQ